MKVFEMGTFHTKCKIENPTDRTRSVVLPKVLVDSGSEYTWVSERSLERIGIRSEKKDVTFVLANGQEVTRSVGFAIIRLDKGIFIATPEARQSISQSMRLYSPNPAISY